MAYLSCFFLHGHFEGRNYQQKNAKEGGGSLNDLLSLERYLLRYKITNGGFSNSIHKFSSALYKRIEVGN